jgi:Zn-dependent peptidase ImmA (M78 family)
MRIIRNKEVEDIVAARLADYENSNGKVAAPVSVDRIIEHCGLSILYDTIEEKPGETILGGLNTKEKLIVINEQHMKLFEEKPGLERSTKAHELGHWDIYSDKASENECLSFNYGDQTNQVVLRNSKRGPLSIILNAWIDDDVYRVYKEYTNRKDHPNVESAVDRYANSLLMPEQLVKDYSLTVDLTEWKNLYKMAKHFEVTISSLCVRLQRLNMIYIKDKKIYRSKGEAMGQKALF